MSLYDNGTNGNLTVTGNISATGKLMIGANDINTNGTLTDVAYLNGTTAFTAGQTINAAAGLAITGGTGTLSVAGLSTLHGITDNNAGGIANTGAITGATAVTATGIITLSGTLGGSTGAAVNGICLNNSAQLVTCSGLQSAYNLGQTITTSALGSIAFNLGSGLATSVTVGNSGTGTALAITDNNTGTTGTAFSISSAATTPTLNLSISETGVIALAGNATSDITTLGNGASNLTLQSNTSTASLTGGALNLYGGNTSAGSSTGGSVNIKAGTGTTNGQVNIGTTNTAGITLGAHLITTTSTGPLISSELLTASSGFTLTTGALTFAPNSGTMNAQGLTSAAISSGTITLNGSTSTGINTTSGNTSIGNAVASSTIALTTGANGTQTFNGGATTTNAYNTSSYNFISNGLTSGTAMYLSSNSITGGKMLMIDGNTNTFTTGTLEQIASNSTGATGGTTNQTTTMLNLASSGVNAYSGHIAYGLNSTVVNSGTGSMNVAGYFSASGGTSNYGLIVDQGLAGFGTTTPTEKLVVGAGYNMGVNLSVVSGTPTASDFSGGGSLGTGNFYYKVTAIDALGHETIASTESNGVNQTVANHKNSLTWNVVTGASAYKIYRTSVSGTYGATSYLTTTTTSPYIDDGTIALSAGTPPTTINSAFAVELMSTGDIFLNNASTSGTLTIGNTQAIRPATGNLALQYKSGPNTWANDLVLNGLGDIDLAGGVGSTGCTITNSNGNLNCTGAIMSNGVPMSGVWQRTAGNLTPLTLNDTIAATSAASTVATFTTNNPAGGTLTDNTLINNTGTGTVTNLLDLTRTLGTVTNAININGATATGIKFTTVPSTNIFDAGAVFTVSNTGYIQGTGGVNVYRQHCSCRNRWKYSSYWKHNRNHGVKRFNDYCRISCYNRYYIW
jgi:hypothetical protein